MDFRLLALFRCLVRVRLESVEVWFAGARDCERRDAIGVSHAEDVFERTEG